MNGGRNNRPPQSPGLMPKHGGFRKLKSFQVAQLAFDVTVRFCGRYIDKRSLTHDQMVQAERRAEHRRGQRRFGNVEKDRVEIDQRRPRESRRVAVGLRGFFAPAWFTRMAAGRSAAGSVDQPASAGCGRGSRLGSGYSRRADRAKWTKWTGWTWWTRSTVTIEQRSACRD